MQFSQHYAGNKIERGQQHQDRFTLPSGRRQVDLLEQSGYLGPQRLLFINLGVDRNGAHNRLTNQFFKLGLLGGGQGMRKIE